VRLAAKVGCALGALCGSVVQPPFGSAHPQTQRAARARRRAPPGSTAQLSSCPGAASLVAGGARLSDLQLLGNQSRQATRFCSATAVLYKAENLYARSQARQRARDQGTLQTIVETIKGACKHLT